MVGFKLFSQNPFFWNFSHEKGQKSFPYHQKAAKERENVKKEKESEQVRETDVGVSDQDYSWYLNREVILPEQFDRALEVENDIDQEKFANYFSVPVPRTA